MQLVIMGARGFVGSKLITALRRDDAINIIPVNLETGAADFVIHLAGVNRPDTEFEWHGPGR